MCGGALADCAASDRAARSGLEVAVQHVWVEVDIARPLDGLRVGVDAYLFKDLSVVSDRGEDSSAGDISDLDQVIHGNGGTGCSRS